jgi:fluoride ion exporter CrcB/FEX
MNTSIPTEVIASTIVTQNLSNPTLVKSKWNIIRHKLPKWTVLCCTAVGAVAGAFVRYALSSDRVFSKYSSMSEMSSTINGSNITLEFNGIKQFPFATFVANTLGAFLMGVCFELLACEYFHARPILQTRLRSGILTGFMGSLTTMSSFAFECALLFQRTSISKYANDSFESLKIENPTNNYTLEYTESSSIWMAWVYLFSTLFAGIFACVLGKSIVFHCRQKWNF